MSITTNVQTNEGGEAPVEGNGKTVHFQRRASSSRNKRGNLRRIQPRIVWIEAMMRRDGPHLLKERTRST